MPGCTAVAVVNILTAAGLPAARPAGYGQDRGEGIWVTDLPVEPLRVAVYFSPPGSFNYLSPVVAATLGAAGYQTEHVADFPGDYLVAWTDGDF
jgi:hypothetical protein